MSENTEILKRAHAKLQDEYTSVFQIKVGEELDLANRPFEWESVGGEIIEQSPSYDPNFSSSIAYFEENIDARFTAMMWRVMPLIAGILPFAILSAQRDDAEGRVPHGPAVEIAKAILGDEL